MTVTNKGKLWETMNLFWIIFSFIILLNGIGMIIAGKRAHIKKWTVAGAAYLTIGWISVLASGISSGITLTAFIGTYIACIIHSFSIRKEYLIRLEIIQNQKFQQIETDALRNKIEKEYGINMDNRNFDLEMNINSEIKKTSVNHKENLMEKKFVDNGNVAFKEVEVNSKNVTNKRTVIDVNTCTQDELLQLPGIGIIDAKKAINLRDRSQFNSVDEFIESLNIKPHFAEKIKPMIVCNRVNINNTVKNAGRMVDF